jgi:single-stranded-DNA-specific exonuclease
VANCLWRSATVDEEEARRISERFGVPLRVAKWLCIRNVPEDEMEEWLYPERAKWLAPEVFWEMPQAVERILRARATGETVCIAGDYDADGVTASAILASTLDAIGVAWHCLIPHRIEDGYGLSVAMVDKAQQLGCTLIVTVDNGIRAHDAISYAHGLGIEVVLTDHHEPSDTPPGPTVATLHWTRADDDGARALSGAGVAWKLATALLDHVYPGECRELREWHTALASLGALADVMPMTVENRKLIRTGMEVLRSCERSGWRALCEVARVDAGALTENSLLWGIAPRLNAAGRMDSAELAFKLLMAADDATAARLATELEALNELRKSETERAYREAYAQHQQQDPNGSQPVVVVSGPWHLGVAGIVAAKLVEAFGRPAIVLADGDEEVLRGSGRAPDGFPLHEVVAACAERLEHFGGHETAIGCAVHRAQLDMFREAVCRAAESVAQDADDTAEEPVADDFLALADATMDTCAWVERFMPHGPGNPPLRFYVGPVELIQCIRMGDGRHLRLRVKEGKHEADLVWFNADAEARDWRPGQRLAAVVCVERNTWQGRTNVQLRVVDAHALANPLLRDEFGYLYRLLQARRRLTLREAENALPGRSQAEAKVVLDTFVELGFAEGTESAYHVVEQVVPRDLRHSIQYQGHLREVAVRSRQSRMR